MGYDLLAVIHHWLVKQDYDILSGNSNNDDDDDNNNHSRLLSAYHLPGLML